MLRQVDHEREELEKLVKHIQSVLLKVSQGNGAYDVQDFVVHVFPKVQQALSEAKINVRASAGRPTDATNWRPGADFDNVRVVIQDQPFELRYFNLYQSDLESDLR